MNKIIVRAAPGREVPIHSSDRIVAGGGHSILRPDDGAVEVADSPGIRRRLRAGDLVRVEAKAVDGKGSAS